MKRWFAFLMGIAVGALGAIFFGRMRAPDPELVTARRRMAALLEERNQALEQAARASSRLASLEIQNADVSHRAEASPQGLLQPLQSASAEERRRLTGQGAPALGRTAPLIVGPPSGYLRDLADTWKRRLSITGAQEQALDRIVAEAEARTLDGGVPDPSAAVWLRREVESILTPEQATKYRQREAENRQIQAESMARATLADIRLTLDGITDAQKSAMLERLLTQAQRDLEKPAEPPDGTKGRAAGVELFRESLLHRLQALEGVLTPSQMEQYRAHLSEMLDRLPAVMPPTPPPAPDQ